MQIDMHYGGAYAMALAAGIPGPDAAVIAYASQFVDDSNRYDSEVHEDGGLLFGITTSAHPHPSLIDLKKPLHGESMEEQRKIWTPFHFFPGGKGDSFREKILCGKDSGLVREMLDNHLEAAPKKAFTLELIGLGAHAYADTFSHYGFSGLGSPLNEITGGLELITPVKPEIFKYITDKAKALTEKTLKAEGKPSNPPGHIAVSDWPDRPYLNWRFNFAQPRPDCESVRDNQATFFEACKGLYGYFSRFAKIYYGGVPARAFEEIAPQIKDVLAFQGTRGQRLELWKQSGLATGMPEYSPWDWEREKTVFTENKDSAQGIRTHIYRFHQAAAYHRYFVLKDLLPSHGLAVF